LKLDDPILTSKRKVYLQRRKETIAYKKIDAETYFKELLEKEPERLIYIRAIEEEFKIKINFLSSI
jgi:hypothetical protein